MHLLVLRINLLHKCCVVVDLPGVEAINITNYLALEVSCDISSQMKAYKGLEVTSIYLSVILFMFLTLALPCEEEMVLGLPRWKQSK